MLERKILDSTRSANPRLLSWVDHRLITGFPPTPSIRDFALPLPGRCPDRNGTSFTTRTKPPACSRSTNLLGKAGEPEVGFARL
jgi:hypothetical protein